MRKLEQLQLKHYTNTRTCTQWYMTIHPQASTIPMYVQDLNTLKFLKPTNLLICQMEVIRVEALRRAPSHMREPSAKPHLLLHLLKMHPAGRGSSLDCMVEG